MNVPELRFPAFKLEWKSLQLNDATDFIDSLHETPKQYVDIGYPMIRVADVNDRGLDLEVCLKVTKEVYEHFTKRYKPQYGDIVFSRVGTCGESVLINFNDEVCLGQNVVLLKPRENYQFLFHYLKSEFIKNQVNEKMVGSSHKTLSLKDARRFVVNVPCPEEQSKIANFLTAVDKKITQLTQKHDLLTQYKKGVMQQIFSHSKERSDCTVSYPRGISQELRFKDDDGQDFPEWEEATLGDIGKFKSGTGFPDSEQGGISGIPFYKVSDMNLAENKLEMLVANNYVSEDQINKMKYKVIHDDAVVFAKVGAAIFLERKRKAKNFLIDNNMMAFIPTCQINFIKHFMDSIRLSKFAQVGALPSYNASDLSIIEIAVPCTKEQTKIANFLTAIDDKLTATQTQLQAVKQYKQGLLQQMFV